MQANWEKMLSGGRFTDLERDAFFSVVRETSGEVFASVSDFGKRLKVGSSKSFVCD